MTPSNTAVTKKYFDPKESGVLVYEVFPSANKTVYHVRGSQAKLFATFTLHGYQGLPSGLYLYRRGFGLGRKGTFLLTALKEHLSAGKPADLIISKTRPTGVKQGSRTVITLSYGAVNEVLVRFGRINEDSNSDLRQTAVSFLRSQFPRAIKAGDVGYNDYKGGELASVLRRRHVEKRLNDEDLASLSQILPLLLKNSSGGGKSLRIARAQFASNTKKATDRVLLDDVMAQFEKLLAKNVSEHKWQEFLGSRVFRFLSQYVTTIEKHNVSLAISYPDFVLVDVYGFIDVFEIKKSTTPLVAFDASHENYYWRPEVVQAISQIENYIEAVSRNAAEYVKVVKRKKLVDIKIVRPRGYIIAGSSTGFESDKAADDFRMLSTSLKNISFIMYDELLARLKNLRSTLR